MTDFGPDPLVSLKILVDRLMEQRRPAGEVSASADLLKAARAFLSFQKVRQKWFGELGWLFAEPAWTILLETFVFDAERADLSVSSAGYASGVPPTTALRYIASLEAANLLLRRVDPFDRRKRYLSLSPLGRSLVGQVLGEYLGRD